jgi:hypothetical protein
MPMNRFSIQKGVVVAFLMAALWVLALAVHVQGVMSSPTGGADDILRDLGSKGIDLPDAQRAEMQADIREMLDGNRTVDIFLGVLLILVGISAYADRIRLAAGLAVLYAVINTTFLLSSWGAINHGFAPIAKSMYLHLGLQTSPAAIVDHLSRPFTLVFGLTVASWFGLRALRRKTNQDKSAP